MKSSRKEIGLAQGIVKEREGGGTFPPSRRSALQGGNWLRAQVEGEKHWDLS